jgi:hypothetical protein
VIGEQPPQRLGRYELISRLGEGGMAEVLLALQRGPAGFEKLVVIKLVHANLATERQFVDMLLDEARVAALVKHPNVVDIYDLGEADGRYFIAMEYLEGEPLLALLRAGRAGSRLDPLSTVRLVADTAEGLDAAHELRTLSGEPLGLVHHDVSLGNIVVLYSGQVKLVDFGVAKANQGLDHGGAPRLHGKLGYMAPEKLRGEPGDRRSDIFSLGVVLWEALTLRRLFRGATEADTVQQVLAMELPGPSRVNGDCPPELDAIVLRALARDVDRRYATAKELAQDLEEELRRFGYGGRNDAIARYMQATFAAQIAARKQLLQEVSTKGQASAEVIARSGLAPSRRNPTSVAQWAEAAIITDLPPPVNAAVAAPGPRDVVMPRPPGRHLRPSGEFSVSFRHATAEQRMEHDAVTEVPGIVESRRRGLSEQLLAEGTPHQLERSGFAGPRSAAEGRRADLIDEPPRKTGARPDTLRDEDSGIDIDIEIDMAGLDTLEELAEPAQVSLELSDLMDSPIEERLPLRAPRTFTPVKRPTPPPGSRSRR